MSSKMKKAVADPKVKKTLLRNYESRIRTELKGVHDVDAGPSKTSKKISSKHFIQKDSLDEPKLCSSEALANYLCDVRKTVPPSLSPEDLNIDRAQISAKVRSLLPFHNSCFKVFDRQK